MTVSHKLKIGIIFGGRSGEHEVSLMSARSLLAVIDRARYDVVQIGIGQDGAWWTGEGALDHLVSQSLDELTPTALLPDPTRRGLFCIRKGETRDSLETLVDLDVIFPVLHGTYGEDGALQGVLEMADIAYVGAGVVGSAVGMDKALFKSVMRASNIPVVDWVVVTRSEIQRDIAGVVDRMLAFAEFPLFTKPANLGSSVGITRCTSASDLMEGLYEAARFDRRVLVERGVVAPREIEVSVLGNDQPVVSVPGEIVPSREFYSYEAKYFDDRSELIIPAPISQELTNQVQQIALRAYQAVDCAGMAQVDFLLEGASQTGEVSRLYLSELNTIPGFTRISMYPKLWDYSGLPYPRLVDRLIELALERKSERDHTQRRFQRGEAYS